MQKQLKQLIEFHTRFNEPYRKEFATPLAPDIIILRYKIMHEEVAEWEEAAETGSPITHRAKELADILYTVFGTIITEGLQDQIEQVFDAVHTSNMTKSDERRSDGKIMKGENYQEPDLKFLLCPAQ